MSFQAVCPLDSVSDASAHKLTNSKGETKRIAIIRDEDGGLHAVDELCTHGDVSLVEGDVEGHCIECWAHGATFNLDTGEQSLPAVEPISVYPLEIRDDQIWVDIN